MKNYLLAFSGGTFPDSPDAGKIFQEKWMAWISSLDGAAEDMGNPVGNNKTVSPEGVVDGGSGPSPLNGYMLVKAGSIDEAVKIAQSCPHIALISGNIEVAEVMPMS